jgi:hypothetical protein
LGDVVDNNSAVGVSVVHGSQRLVALLTGRIPDLELDSGVLVERNGLGEESSADSRLAIRIELVLEGICMSSEHSDVGIKSLLP